MNPRPLHSSTRLRALFFASASLTVACAVFAAAPASDEVLDGLAIARRIEARPDGENRSQRVEMTLGNRRGKERHRSARIFRRTTNGDRRTALFYDQPHDVRGTGFLTYDYAEPGREDDQWLYLPSLQRVRRISASDRGDWFMGTDLTYEDVKKDGKFEVEESQWRRLENAEVDGFVCWVVEARLESDAVAGQLGHASARIWVDQSNDYPRKIEYFDSGGALLRTVHTTSLEKLQGIWTALEIRVENHRRGTRSRFTFLETDYERELNDQLFTQSQLKRGAPR